MCLYTGMQLPCIARTDIVCYKVMRRRPSFKKYGELGYYGLYHDDFEYEQPGKTTIDFLQDKRYDNSKTVLYGLHSFVSLERAIELKEMYGNTKKFSVVECIIPKGTPFYYGYDGGHYACYCSKALTIVKEMPTYY